MISRTTRHFAAVLNPSFEANEVAALEFTVREDSPGALNRALKCFFDNNLNLTHIESKPASAVDSQQGHTFIVDIEAPEPAALERATQSLRGLCSGVTLLSGLTVPWFPRSSADLAELPQSTSLLPQGHPGFQDAEYLQRRTQLQSLALALGGQQIPLFDYTAEELRTWRTLYIALSPLYQRTACAAFNCHFRELEAQQLIQENQVPQLAHLSSYLQEKTGFQLKPVASLVAQRDFLNCLAFKVFPATVHMRHHLRPYFSMDPDVAHEALGHVPMLADQDFAEFVQELGLLSLGATDEAIQKLMNLYFYSVEHGILLTAHGKREIYGARLLSSVDEIYHMLSERPELRHFDPFQACKFKYSRKSLQSVYWFSSHFKEAKALLERFEGTLKRPFHVVFDRKTGTVKVDQKVRGVR